MRDYAKIGSSLWGSKKFRSLDDTGRLLYLYILTCPHARSVGCYVLPAGYMVFDTQMDQKTIDNTLQALATVDLIRLDHTENLVYITGWIEHYEPSSPNHCKKMIYDICALPDSPLKTLVARDLLAAMDGKGWDTEIGLLKGCASSSEGLQEGFVRSAAPNLTYHLTSHNLTIQEEDGDKGHNPDDVSGGTQEGFSWEGMGKGRTLWQEFPGCNTASDFIEAMPQRWLLVLNKFIHNDPDSTFDAQAAFCSHFWGRYVGDFPGAEVEDKFPTTQNWFWRWQHQCEEWHLRSVGRQMPKVDGSKARRARQQKLNPNQRT